MFRQLAQKFKGPMTTSETFDSKVFYEKEHDRVYFSNSRDGDQQFEIYKSELPPPYLFNNHPFVDKIDFDGLKLQYNLNYLY